MNPVIPRDALCAAVEPHYPRREMGGRRSGLKRTLRIHFLQHWFNLADLACGEALHERASLRHLAGIDLGSEAAPDATILREFRRLMEQHKLAYINVKPSSENRITRSKRQNFVGFSTGVKHAIAPYIKHVEA